MPGKLTYFDLDGRAGGIRALLGHANFEYEDDRQSFESFATLKASLPLGSMPVWEEDGIQYCQSSGILRMLGVRLGYYTTDPNTAWAIDSIVDFVEDLQPKFAGWLFPAVQGGQLEAGEGADQWIADYWDKVIPVIDARLAAHGKPFIGGTDRPTIADFKAIQTVVSSNPEFNPACIIPTAVQQQLAAKQKASPHYH